MLFSSLVLGCGAQTLLKVHEFSGCGQLDLGAPCGMYISSLTIDFLGTFTDSNHQSNAQEVPLSGWYSSGESGLSTSQLILALPGSLNCPVDTFTGGQSGDAVFIMLWVLMVQAV